MLKVLFKGVILPFSSAKLASSPPSWPEVIFTLLSTRYWLGKCQRGRIWVMVMVVAFVVPNALRSMPERPAEFSLITPGPLTWIKNVPPLDCTVRHGGARVNREKPPTFQAVPEPAQQRVAAMAVVAHVPSWTGLPPFCLTRRSVNFGRLLRNRQHRLRIEG